MAWGVPKIGASVIDATGDFDLIEPVGVAEGDLMVACIAYKGANAITAPSGWSAPAELVQNTGDLDATDGIAGGVMFYIVRGASAPSLTCTRTAEANSTAYAKVISYSGGGASPYDTGSSASQGAAGATPTTASFSTAAAGELIVAFVAMGDQYTASAFDAATDPATASGATDTTTAPTNGTWIERFDANTNTGADTGIAIADALRATAGATGTIQCTISSASGRNALFAAAFKLPGSSASSSVSSSVSSSASSSISLSPSSSVSSSSSSSQSPSSSVSSSISLSPSVSVSSSISLSPSSSVSSSISLSPSSSQSPSSSDSASPSSSVSASISLSPSSSVSSSISLSPSSSQSPSSSVSSSVSLSPSPSAVEVNLKTDLWSVTGSSPSSSASSSESASPSSSQSPSSSVSSSISSSPSSSQSPSSSVSSSVSLSPSSSASASESPSPSASGATGRLHYWNGSAWIQKDFNVFNGSTFVSKPTKFWDGTQWL